MRRSLRRISLSGRQEQLGRSRHQLRERWPQLVAVLEEGHACKHVETETGTRHGDNETSHVADVTDVLGAYERQDDVVVLLSLETINCGDFRWFPEVRVVAAAFVDDVPDEMFLMVRESNSVYKSHNLFCT